MPQKRQRVKRKVLLEIRQPVMFTDEKERERERGRTGNPRKGRYSERSVVANLA